MIAATTRVPPAASARAEASSVAPVVWTSSTRIASGGGEPRTRICRRPGARRSRRVAPTWRRPVGADEAVVQRPVEAACERDASARAPGRTRARAGARGRRGPGRARPPDRAGPPGGSRPCARPSGRPPTSAPRNFSAPRGAARRPGRPPAPTPRERRARRRTPAPAVLRQPAPRAPAAQPGQRAHARHAQPLVRPAQRAPARHAPRRRQQRDQFGNQVHRAGDRRAPPSNDSASDRHNSAQCLRQICWERPCRWIPGGHLLPSCCSHSRPTWGSMCGGGASRAPRAAPRAAPVSKLVLWITGVACLFVALVSPVDGWASSSPRCTWSSTC